VELSKDKLELSLFSKFEIKLGSTCIEGGVKVSLLKILRFQLEFLDEALDSPSSGERKGRSPNPVYKF